MRATDKLRDYLDFREIRARWKLSPDGTDLHWMIARGVLRPCVWMRGPHPLSLLDPQVGFVPVTGPDGARAKVTLGALCYPVGQIQTDLYEYTYSHACDQTQDEPRYVEFERPLKLSEILGIGVVLMPDLDFAEREMQLRQEDGLHGKERQTLQRIALTAVIDAYGWDPLAERSHAIPDLVRSANGYGLPVSENTVREHLRRAWDSCKPVVEDTANTPA